jgi:branched-chain amino acid transport system permease protein
MTSATSAPVAAAPPAADAIPKRRFDLVPVALVVVLALLAWPVVGSSSTWFTLTVAGLAMG